MVVMVRGGSPSRATAARGEKPRNPDACPPPNYYPVHLRETLRRDKSEMEVISR
jgi:hypothetical protein